MKPILDKYLTTVDKHLRPLSVSERVDIVKEIKSLMLEMENNGLSSSEIIERLGKPKQLAGAYLSDLVTKGTGFNWRRARTLWAFYSVAGFSGIFVIPLLTVASFLLIACAVVSPILATIKLVNYFFHLGIPFIEQFKIVFYGILELNPLGEFIVALIFGIILYWAGLKVWTLLMKYCQIVSRTKKRLLI
jgi:uncharacterized membrane protein